MKLAFETLTREDETAPQKWVVFVHGILGRGANWRTPARKLIAERPGWGAVLVDLRGHGASHSEGPFTIDAASRDLVELHHEPQLRGRIAELVGHSLGGKITLAAVHDLAREEPLERAWILDAAPGVRDDESDLSAREVVAVLEGLAGPWTRRADFVSELTGLGLSVAVSQWLATNLQRDDAGWHFGLDLSAMVGLIEDYGRVDMWPVLEDPPPSTELNVVLGGRSTTVGPRARSRLEALSRAGACEVHVLPTSGHWVHVDDPRGLLALLTR